MYAASPRYASVLPPPVGKNSSCTSAFAGSPSPRCASACAGWVSPGRHSSTNASWNGRHDRFSGTSRRRSSPATSAPGADIRARTTSDRTRCSAIAWFANRNASRAIPSVRSSSIARSSRPATSRAAATARSPASPYRAISGSDFHPGSLLGQPLPVPGHQRPQRPHQVIAPQLRRPEPGHVEHQAWHLPRHDEPHLRRREARRGKLPRPHLAITHGSVDRALPPVRVLARRPVQQLQVQPLVVRPRRRLRDVRVVVPAGRSPRSRPARSRSAPPGTAAPCPGSSPASAAR